MFRPFWPSSWQATTRFHAHLFRCFLLGFLDELVFPSRSSERFLAILADMGLAYDAGHLHGPISHRTGGRDDAMLRCPPKWRYEAALWPSFALNVPVESFMGVVPPFSSQLINTSHGLYDERTAFSGTMVGCVLLGMLTLAFVIRRSSITSGTRSRGACRLWRAAKSRTPDSDTRVIGSSTEERLSMHDEIDCFAADTGEDVHGRVFASGHCVIERPVQNTTKTFHQLVRDGIRVRWTLISQITMKAWTYILDLVRDLPSSDGSNDRTILEPNHEGGRPPVFQKLGSVKGGFHSDISVLATLPGNERLELAANRLASQSSRSTGSVSGLTTAVHDPLHLPSAINAVAIGPIPPQGTVLDKVCKAMSSWRKIGSVVDAAKVNLNLNSTLSPSDDIVSEIGSARSGDEESLGVATQRADMPPSERKDRCDGSSGFGSLLLLRRARTADDIWGKRDRSDNDEDDSYWTEQVHARLSGGFHRARCRYGWSDALWPREGCEDESNNWRTRSSQVVAGSVGSEETHDTQTGDNRLRRHSSPCLNASLSQGTASGDGPQEIYVIPQKRGRVADDQCWSSPRLSDYPSGLGFLPFRKTPTLFTPTAWKPGCLYVPDPPEGELREAAAWWDDLTSVGRCDTGSTAEHVPVIRDGLVNEKAVLFSRDRPPEGPVSWRDRYENDPASRRFVPVHRRVVTDG